MPRTIPSPELVTETVDGAIYELPSGVALVVGEVPSALAVYTPIRHGTLTLYFALPLLIPMGGVIIPGLFAAERGAFLVGREAWDFVLGNFQEHARADVVGIAPNGEPAQAYLREVDMGAPVLVYADGTPDNPKVLIEALVLGNNAPPLPDLLSRYLPVKPLDALLSASEG